MIFELVFACMAFVLSYVFFNITHNFKQKVGLLPPTVIFKTDEYGIKTKETIWQTPDLKGYWNNDNICFVLFCLFVVRWGLIIFGLILIADTISYILHFNTLFLKKIK